MSKIVRRVGKLSVYHRHFFECARCDANKAEWIVQLARLNQMRWHGKRPALRSVFYCDWCLPERARERYMLKLLAR